VSDPHSTMQNGGLISIGCLSIAERVTPVSPMTLRMHGNHFHSGCVAMDARRSTPRQVEVIPPRARNTYANKSSTRQRTQTVRVVVSNCLVAMIDPFIMRWQSSSGMLAGQLVALRRRMSLARRPLRAVRLGPTSCSSRRAWHPLSTVALPKILMQR